MTTIRKRSLRSDGEEPKTAHREGYLTFQKRGTQNIHLQLRERPNLRGVTKRWFCAEVSGVTVLLATSLRIEQSPLTDRKRHVIIWARRDSPHNTPYRELWGTNRLSAPLVLDKPLKRSDLSETAIHIMPQYAHAKAVCN